MSLSKARKRVVVKEWAKHEKDTGSTEVQIALLTERIREITEHLKAHPKDVHSRYGLAKLVSKRKKLLKYLKRIDFSKYQEVLRKLGIRG